jgi:hypothetical protein
MAAFRGGLTDLDYAEERVRASTARVPVVTSWRAVRCCVGGMHG